MSRDDYIEVSERLQTFYKQYPDGSLQSEYEVTEVLGQTIIVMKAYAYRTPEDPRPGIGHAWEMVPGRTPFTKGSELMVGETSAWGRALAALGIAVHRGIASAQEVRAAGGHRIERSKGQVEDQWTTPQTYEPTVPHSEPGQRTHTAPTEKQIKAIFALLKRLKVVDAGEQKELLNDLLKLNNMKLIESTKDLTANEASFLIGALKKAVDVDESGSRDGVSMLNVEPPP
jgi:hypothetical protein